jgi:hypothetical protein
VEGKLTHLVRPEQVSEALTQECGTEFAN